MTGKRRSGILAALVIASVATLAACIEDGPTPYTGGPRDANSSNVHAAGDWIKIRANLAGNPSSLTICTNHSRCIWAGTAS